MIAGGVARIFLDAICDPPVEFPVAQAWKSVIPVHRSRCGSLPFLKYGDKRPE